MTLPTLYNFDLDDHCYRLRLTASICGVDLDILNINTFPGHDHLAPDYLLKNPLGRVPTLEHDGLILRETAAIQTYIAALSKNKSFVPESLVEQAAMTDWMIFADRDLASASAARATALLDVPGDGPALTATARKMLQIMEDHMTRQRVLGKAFFVANTVTLADLALFPAFALSRDFSIDHDAFPALRRWARQLRTVDGFITMPGIPDYH
ncbi:glutathione S-transferase family protein [Pacificibacter marinus]|uniref:Glutathionine S-transferase n=1 Tax=Pacificibacter marinus TaxID=658057 RepID=A0A1Y5T8H2_9RHOB|nr:glutathione S-transferase family protein [Pacificibacter marinus]SEL21759.1 glutathione S-transferase [Pacificibacter marinus]SLN56363.1 glutathionine S-transferase [Pacificibacter marinus]